MPRVRVNVYVDAFNLYYGALRGTPYRWLDLEKLCRRLLPRDEIQRIRYFMALISARTDDPRDPQRQAYLRALRTLPTVSIHLCRFLSRPVRMPLRNPSRIGPRTVEVLRTEEKGSDVNLATYLLLDAFEGDCEVAVVISNDSDLATPIKVVRERLGVAVGVVNPHLAGRRSRALEPTFFKQLRPSVLPACQFPDRLADDRGEITRPEGW